MPKKISRVHAVDRLDEIACFVETVQVALSARGRNDDEANSLSYVLCCGLDGIRKLRRRIHVEGEAR